MSKRKTKQRTTVSITPESTKFLKKNGDGEISGGIEATVSKCIELENTVKDLQGKIAERDAELSEKSDTEAALKNKIHEIKPNSEVQKLLGEVKSKDDGLDKEIVEATKILKLDVDGVDKKVLFSPEILLLYDFVQTKGFEGGFSQFIRASVTGFFDMIGIDVVVRKRGSPA